MLELRIAQKATLQIRTARNWLHERDPAAEARFAERLATLLTKLCEDLPHVLASGPPPQLDEDGDRQPEALEVLRVFHAAAELPWDRIESME